MSLYIEKPKAKPRGGQKQKISVGYISLIVLVLVFFYKMCTAINNYSERGAHAYVQLLNYSLPIIKVEAYDETVYSETSVGIKNILLEALGVNNISTFGILGSEITLFDSLENNMNNDIPDISTFKPFELNNDSISLLTDEELREISSDSKAYDAELKTLLEGKDLEVLIYHTHSQEGYAEIGSEGRWNTLDKTYNITGVGDLLTKELEEGYGITVIHDETIHDTDYNICYSESRKTAQRYLNDYGGFNLIIDLHRDAAGKGLTTVNLNDESLARIMYVVGKNSPLYSQNRALADKFANITTELFPSLLRGKPVYEYEAGISQGFNLGLNENMLLIEVGGNENSIEEAKRTTKYIARIIAEYLYSVINE